MSQEESFDKRSKSDQHRNHTFTSIVHHYRILHKKLEDAGTGPYQLTSKGVWAASRAPHVFSFFKSLELGRFNCFLDLGSGDGIVTCIAGMFTRSIGIEADFGLCRTARRAAMEMGLDERVSFICGDYLTQRIWNADCLYLYPDKPFYSIEALLEGWSGSLLVYGPHIPPRNLEPTLRLRCGKERLVVYQLPTSGT
jgi:hypothetical protein